MLLIYFYLLFIYYLYIYNKNYYNDKIIKIINMPNKLILKNYINNIKIINNMPKLIFLKFVS